MWAGVPFTPVRPAGVIPEAPVSMDRLAGPMEVPLAGSATSTNKVYGTAALLEEMSSVSPLSPGVWRFVIVGGVSELDVELANVFNEKIISPGGVRTPVTTIRTVMTFAGTLGSITTGRAVVPNVIPDRKSTRLNSSHRCISYA